MAANRAKALAARDLLCRTLGVTAPAPDSMIGSMASVPLPDGDGRPPAAPYYLEPLQEWLFTEAHIEVPICTWPAPPKRLVRVSAQLYNTPAEYQRLVDALPAGLAIA